MRFQNPQEKTWRLFRLAKVLITIDLENQIYRIYALFMLSYLHSFNFCAVTFKVSYFPLGANRHP